MPKTSKFSFTKNLRSHKLSKLRKQQSSDFYFFCRYHLSVNHGENPADAPFPDFKNLNVGSVSRSEKIHSSQNLSPSEISFFQILNFPDFGKLEFFRFFLSEHYPDSRCRRKSPNSPREASRTSFPQPIVPNDHPNQKSPISSDICSIS